MPFTVSSATISSVHASKFDDPGALLIFMLMACQNTVGWQKCLLFCSLLICDKEFHLFLIGNFISFIFISMLTICDESCHCM